LRLLPKRYYNQLAGTESCTGYFEGWAVIMATSLVPQANLWLECDGQVVLSRWRVQLLEAIEDTGSISAAAERMQVQYRRAWEKLEEMEAGLGVHLVERQVGGNNGGGARLTEAGHRYVAHFKYFVQGIDEIIAQQFKAAFAEG
jgi:molybdate transport system regulatory protein